MFTTWDSIPMLDRVFDDVMRQALGASTNAQGFTPDVDVRADEEKVVFCFDVPGFKEEDLDVTVENHVLTVQGQRKFQSNDKERVMLGRRYGSFARSFKLPESADDEHLTAALADGVLTITIPRHARARARKITIGGSTDKQLGT